MGHAVTYQSIQARSNHGRAHQRSAGCHPQGHSGHPGSRCLSVADRSPDGSFVQLLGRWSDWLFPPGSFDDEPGMLDGTPVLAMSVSGMLAMKEQFPGLRNGRPWRQKDIDDIEVLRRLAAQR